MWSLWFSVSPERSPGPWPTGILMLFGAYIVLGQQYLRDHVKHRVSLPKSPQGSFGYVLLGVTLFFATGLDDIIAYSNLMISNGAWEFISLGVITATIASVFMANLLSKSLKRMEHPERIGGSIILLMGVLVASGVL